MLLGTVLPGHGREAIQALIGKNGTRGCPVILKCPVNALSGGREQRVIVSKSSYNGARLES